MTKTNGLYANLKGQAYELATISGGRTNPEAETEGFRDVFDRLMSDSDHPRQAHFLMALPSVLSEPQRMILLDGMAQEYAGLDGWMAYVDRES